MVDVPLLPCATVGRLFVVVHLHRATFVPISVGAHPPGAVAFAPLGLVKEKPKGLKATGQDKALLKNIARVLLSPEGAVVILLVIP